MTDWNRLVRGRGASVSGLEYSTQKKYTVPARIRKAVMHSTSRLYSPRSLHFFARIRSLHTKKPRPPKTMRNMITSKTSGSP